MVGTILSHLHVFNPHNRLLRWWYYYCHLVTEKRRRDRLTKWPKITEVGSEWHRRDLHAGSLISQHALLTSAITARILTSQIIGIFFM